MRFQGWDPAVSAYYSTPLAGRKEGSLPLSKNPTRSPLGLRSRISAIRASGRGPSGTAAFGK